LIMAMAVPVFLAGFVEDVTAKVTPSTRFLVSMITGLLFVWFTGYSITRVDINLINPILSIEFISIFLTVLSLAGLANAMNIIDGLNGLASGTALFMCAAIVFVSIRFDDHEFIFIGLSLVSALVGFMIWNFPKGRVFLGDGGAYFIGAIIAGLVIALPERHSEISPFFSLSLVSYPIYELLRTVLRRSIVSGRQAFDPDNQHLHSLLYHVVLKRTNFSSTAQNALASTCMLTFPLILSICSIGNYGDISFLVVMLISFICIYEMMTMVLNFLRK
jgi:UDP-N-acetylmuramyl pentapeptide phosphotransferase/UDP-N-acetylglucosamine-1-phosphate transferase